MSVRKQWKLIVGGLGARRRTRTSAGGAALRDFLDRSTLVAACIFLFTVASIVAISSVGMTTLYAPLQPNQIATTRLVASTPFSYVSQEKSREAREALIQRVPPVFRIELDPLNRFD